MLKDNVIVVAFNAKLSDGCDYATQTMKILGRTNVIYGLVLGEPITWKGVVFGGSAKKVLHRGYNSTLIRPFFFFPGQRFALIKHVNYFLNALMLRVVLALRHPTKKKMLWFFEPWNIVPVYAAFRGYTALYDCVDYFALLGYESPRAEQYLIQHADYMTCISPALTHRYRSVRNDIVTVPLGFATNKFSFHQSKLGACGARPFTVGYIGGLNYRIDWGLLTRVIQSLPHVRFVFVGPIQTGLIQQEVDVLQTMQTLLSQHNVSYVGDVPKSEVGGYMRVFDVGMIPYDERYAFNRYSFPMKVMEYFWYGLPVVTTNIASLRKYTDLIRVESTPRGWTRAIRHLLESEWPKRLKATQRNIAYQNTWEEKLEAISSLLSSGRHIKVSNRQ